MTDYKKLWESMDIDLEKHDQLCNLLPGFFADVYLSQENRPEGMNYFNLVVSSIHGLRPEELKRHKDDGGKVVGTFCVYVPDELIVAAGAIGIGLCGGSQFWVPDGEKVLPKNTCPLIKSFMGAKITRTCPYFQSCDLLVGETTCDGKKKAWEILENYADIHVMHLPQMKRDVDIKAWVQEIEILKEKLEKLTGNEITPDKLKDAIRLINEKRRALKRLYELRKARPVPISGKDALLVSQIAFYDDPERFTSKVNDLCDELEERVKSGEGVFPAHAKRILITGTPMAIPNWKLHHIVESSGAVVVCEETCTGTRYFENFVEEASNTLEGQFRALAERYMKTNCACFTPNRGRIDDIIRLAREYEADGVIYYNLQFCQPYAVEYELVRRALQKEGIPVILIETDYSENDSEQVKTRVQAFLEMLG
ncbi:double-cubane-cluster-containing anaerobic reductase [Thermosediminibacter oceani]|uniref:2-hydroxyglutaryl-CoA dehydratase D-component n=1 Tax=Thermosediminibacter oceani (strain ATCC BAA-1034 / DSM 16646 / JW/IW-1228P) TaxID=555079 RepID=D9RYM7_THEOJ|nr:double-cubane-cluster-containing anaerobic reductase [Thermosediminibacter oceani]ADL08451.1 2-hydroxyglutaryl-CoA dehydratase D-component [Thermosediminibacter oceani DSM 16646]